MRVLQVLSSLNRMSGVANVVMNYYRLLKDKLTFDFLLFSEMPSSFTEEAKSYGSNVWFIPKFGLGTYGKYKKQIDTLFKEHQGEWDAVHIEEILSQRIILPIAHKYGMKVIMHSHGPYPGIKMVGIARGLRNKFLLHGFDTKADFYLACSEHAATAFRKTKNAIVLKNGVDYKRYFFGADMREELGLDSGTLAIGCVGRICKQKNPAAFIKIFAAVKERRQNSVLVIAGDGDEQYVSLLKKITHEYGLDNSVKMIGRCERVPELMRSLDALLMPSLWEGLPVVLVEAQAAGLPCVCSDNVSREADLIGNVTFLSLSDSDSTWADALLNGKKADAEQIRAGFVRNGYDLETNADILLDIYSRVI